MLTPSEKLPVLTMRAPAEPALAMAQSSSLLHPVVPMISTSPRSAASSLSMTLTAGPVKSMIASAPTSAALGSSPMVTPSFSMPANSPASRPMAPEPGRSKAEWTTRPGVAVTARILAAPIRPPAPAMATLRSVMMGLYSPRRDARVRAIGNRQSAVEEAAIPMADCRRPWLRNPDALHLLADRQRRRFRVGRRSDRPADHQVAGAGGDGLGRTEGALLAAGVGALWPDARSNDRHLRPDDGAHHLRLERRGHEAADSGGLRLFGAQRHQTCRIAGESGFRDVGIVHRGQHRDAKDDQLRAGGGPGRGAHALRVGMDGEHGGAGSRDRGGALFDRVVDIEQLEVEEHALSGRDQGFAERQSVAAIDELVADLEEVGGALERLDQPLGLCAGIHIEGDDQRSGHVSLRFEA